MILPSIVIASTPESSTPLPILISCVLGYGPVAGGSEVVLRGAYLSDASSVTIGGVECDFVVDDDTQITAITEAHAAGAVNIEATTPGGSCSLLSGFIFQEAPDLSGASLSVVVGPHSIPTFITVTGCLRIMEGATATLNGEACFIHRIDQTSFTLYAPGCDEGDIGPADLVVTNPDGQTDTLANAFTYHLGVELREFDRGADMDAIAQVGGVYKLIGTATRATIAVLECVTVGPVTYRIQGRGRWYQATGDEFNGVFKWAVVGAASAITWGATPGSRTAGGLIHGGGGTIELQGLALQYSGIATSYGIVYAIAWDSAPATGRCVMMTWTRPGVDTNIYGGGVGYSTTNFRCASCGNTSRDAPTLSTGGSTLTATVSAEWLLVAGKYPNLTNATTAYGTAQTGSAAPSPAATNSANLNGVTDSRPSYTKVGNSNVLLLETHFVLGGAT